MNENTHRFSDMPNGLRSEIWLNNPHEPDESAIYLERFAVFGLTRGELQSGRPIIGVAQSGSNLSPCNFVHVGLEDRIKAGVRDAGGIPLVFPTHPIQETFRRPTAAIDRNLSYLTLVEILSGNPLDGVVLTTGCDKTTPAALMAAATVDIPAIVLSGGPMLDGHWRGKLAGSGMVMWESRRQLAAGEIDTTELFERELASVPSLGHCNTMGTALTMNSLAEALGMSLPGCAAIPASYAARSVMAYETGKRAVEMVREGLVPSQVLVREAFENAIVVASAIGGSTNAPPHVNAIAAHAGVDLSMSDWDRLGYRVPLLANVQPAGAWLGEAFHRAGGVPAIFGELLAAGLVHGDVVGVSGRSRTADYGSSRSEDRDVIRTVADPVAENAGLMVLHGNLFESAVMKMSVVGPEFREKYLNDPDDPEAFTATAFVFEGPEDYRRRIDDPKLDIDDRSILVIRNTGPVGYPGSAEVVNMTPPGRLIRTGVRMLPCLGDGRQSGTSDSPSILNVSPESAVGGVIGLVRDGDKIRVDLRAREVTLQVDDTELDRRREYMKPEVPPSHTPWEELYRANVNQLSDGATLVMATKYHQTGRVVPRNSH